jgi:dihydrofolate reductase
MGMLVISENVSLDGINQDDGFRHSGWSEQYMGQDREEWAKIELAEAYGADALLLGRRTDEYFGTRWNVRTGEWADRLNALPKYVVSSALIEPVWTNSTVLSGDVAEQVTKLKEQVTGEIVVYGSGRLVRELMEHDLVDEIRLIVFPVVLGAGERLFGETTNKTSLRRLDARTLGANLSCVSFAVERSA